MFLLRGNALDDWRSLRNRDAAQLQSTPRRDAHAANSERGAEAPAQLLLNLRVCTLRLHIQIDAGQGEIAPSAITAPRAIKGTRRNLFTVRELRSSSLKKR